LTLKKGGGRDRNREIGQDRRIKSLPIRTSAILTGAYWSGSKEALTGSHWFSVPQVSRTSNRRTPVQN